MTPYRGLLDYIDTEIGKGLQQSRKSYESLLSSMKQLQDNINTLETKFTTIHTNGDRLERESRSNFDEIDLSINSLKLFVLRFPPHPLLTLV
jgi:hypothetical protein